MNVIKKYFIPYFIKYDVVMKKTIELKIKISKIYRFILESKYYTSIYNII